MGRSQNWRCPYKKTGGRSGPSRPGLPLGGGPEMGRQNGGFPYKTCRFLAFPVISVCLVLRLAGAGQGLEGGLMSTKWSKVKTGDVLIKKLEQNPPNRVGGDVLIKKLVGRTKLLQLFSQTQYIISLAENKGVWEPSDSAGCSAVWEP